MLTLFQPQQGHVYRMAFATLMPIEFKACFHPDLGYFRADSLEHEAYAIASQGDNGVSHVYRLLPVLVWDLGKSVRNTHALFTQDTIATVKAAVLVLDRWAWEKLERQWKAYPPLNHDYTFICNQFQPWVHYDMGPCREAFLPKFKASDKPVAQAVMVLAERLVKAAISLKGEDIIPSIDVEDLDALFALRTAEQVRKDAVWEAKEAKRQAAMTPDQRAYEEAMFDTMFDHLEGDKASPHTERESENGDGPRQRLETLISDLKTEPYLARLVRQALAEAPR